MTPLKTNPNSMLRRPVAFAGLFAPSGSRRTNGAKPVSHAYNAPGGKKSPAVPTGTRWALALFALALLTGVPALGQDAAARLDNYPTETRAEYVFACMAVNGQSRDMLQKCSCSIDRISAVLPYDDYVEAETVLSMRLVGGERMAIFQNSITTQKWVAPLRRAQAEAEMLCF